MGQAAEASGRKALLTALRSPAHRDYLRRFAPELASSSAEELLERMLQELEFAELVDNFGRPDEPEWNCGKSVTLDPERGPSAPYFYSQWMLQALEILPLDPANNVFLDAVETSIFGFPAFPNASQPDVETASSRPVYAGLNMYRASAGNPQCGPISAVISRRWVQADAVAAAVDTGLFNGSCGAPGTRPAAQYNGTTCFRCEAWPPASEQLGAPGHLAHLILPYLTFFNATQEIAGENYTEYNLARLVSRLLSRRTYGKQEPEVTAQPVQLNFMENVFGYLEVNPLVTVRYPEGISMMIGVFEVLFGTEEGKRLRDWCIAQSWPLAWATNPRFANWDCFDGNCSFPVDRFYSDGDSANQRLLDPVVLQSVSEGHNMTSHSSFNKSAHDFEALWAQAADVKSEDRMRWSRHAWRQLNGAPALAVEPLYAGACASDSCVAVRLDGACVCPPAVVEVSFV